MRARTGGGPGDGEAPRIASSGARSDWPLWGVDWLYGLDDDVVGRAGEGSTLVFQALG